MKKLPIGFQEIEEIINNGYLYVDKTKLINELISEGKYYFLSRPRRFGKSLLISTLEQIFLGNREVFKGLYIYDKIHWQKHPVIRINFGSMSYKKGKNGFEKDIIDTLKEIAEKNNIEITTNSIPRIMVNLVESLSAKGQVVILVDEYDKPIVDSLTDLSRAQENREILRELYSSIKDLDKYIKFVFLTGVSKFSKVSIFSGLNNLNDITLEEKFNSICGITQEELESNFNLYIELLAKREKLDIDNTKKKIKEWYNGYSWDGVTTVYNPFSLLKLFYSNKFKNYWFATGTPTFLVNCFKERQFNVMELENIKSSDVSLDVIEVGDIDLVSLLFQTGYITIKEVVDDSENETYRLSYPNREVKNSLIKYLLAGYTSISASTVDTIYRKLIDVLKNSDVKSFETILQSVFAGIPYNVQANLNEYNYQGYFYLILTLLGVYPQLEIATDKGRIDAVLELKDKIYIIEFKIGDVQEAINQIKEKKYYEKYLNAGKEIYLLGVGGFEKKDIKCLMEKI